VTSNAWQQNDRLYHETSGIPFRQPLSWRNGARLAISVVISIEYYEMQPAKGSCIPPNMPGGFGRAPYPDFRAFTQRDYGNRVGIFRVMEALDRASIPATAAVDSSVATRYPYIVEQCLRRNFEIAGHGHSVTNVISNHMSESQERAYIESALDTVERISGKRPTGWHGPEHGESERTPALLAELGLSYVLDWPNDEQPFMMRTPGGSLVSLAMALELDDVVTMWHRRVSGERWRQAISEAVDQLLADGTRERRHLILNLHPWLIGHPHRIGYLEEVLEGIRAREGVWITTAAEIAAQARSSLDG
jgi:peptidoglycan/xylan/chitin deacetylase (PgdA/CDA1 family)